MPFCTLTSRLLNELAGGKFCSAFTPQFHLVPCSYAYMSPLWTFIHGHLSKVRPWEHLKDCSAPGMTLGCTR